MTSLISWAFQYDDIAFFTRFFQAYAEGVDSIRSSMEGRLYLTNRRLAWVNQPLSLYV